MKTKIVVILLVLVVSVLSVLGTLSIVYFVSKDNSEKNDNNKTVTESGSSIKDIENKIESGSIVSEKEQEVETDNTDKILVDLEGEFVDGIQYPEEIKALKTDPNVASIKCSDRFNNYTSYWADWRTGVKFEPEMSEAFNSFINETIYTDEFVAKKYNVQWGYFCDVEGVGTIAYIGHGNQSGSSEFGDFMLLEKNVDAQSGKAIWKPTESITNDGSGYCFAPIAITTKEVNGKKQIDELYSQCITGHTVASWGKIEVSELGVAPRTIIYCGSKYIDEPYECKK